MTTSTRLSAYGAALLVAFAVAWGIGAAVAPPAPMHSTGEVHP
jgi:hypothetical protein